MLCNAKTINLFKLSVIVVINLFITELYAQARVNQTTSKIDSIERLATLQDFTYWEYNSTTGNWIGEEKGISNRNKPKNGIHLFEIESDSMRYFAILTKTIYEGDNVFKDRTEFIAYLFNDYNFIELFEVRGLNEICSSGEISFEEYYVDSTSIGSDLGFLEKITVTDAISDEISKYEYRDFYICGKKYPVYSAAEKTIRFYMYEKNWYQEAYERFSQGPYIETESSLFFDFISSVGLENINEVKRQKPDSTAIEKYSRTMFKTIGNFSPIVQNVSTKPDFKIYIGSGTQSTEGFYINKKYDWSSYSLKYQNTGSYFNIDLKRTNDLELISNLLLPNTKSGCISLNKINESNQVTLFVESDNNWEIEINSHKCLDDSDEEEQDDSFFVVAEQMPQLRGGLANLQRKVRYPEEARRMGIEGRVTVQFIVGVDGSIENPRVIRSIGGGCDEEALRVIKSATFTPGKQRGRPVRVQYSLPIVFRL